VGDGLGLLGRQRRNELHRPERGKRGGDDGAVGAKALAGPEPVGDDLDPVRVLADTNDRRAVADALPEHRRERSGEPVVPAHDVLQRRRLV